MINNINPFHELYFTESIDSDDFVKLFSDVLVEPALPLFKPGNVILKGLPGSGKSMMLNLLRPSIRLAYKKAGMKFPVPARYNKFIGAGINLIRSSISDFGQRPINGNKEDDINELSIYFGDFLNYWICKDIIDSIEELAPDLSEEIGINWNANCVDLFVSSLIKDDCWFNYLEGVKGIAELKDRLKSRTNTYRAYLNYNLSELPINVRETKTSIGIPVISLVQKLRESGVLNKDVQVFVRIDQFEELTWLDYSIAELGSIFQSVIHKLLAMRDATVSYRIGTRPFDWQQGSQKIFGTSAQLEALRNYKEVSIEDIFRRSESQRGYIFPEFAEDIFARRLDFSFLPFIKHSNSLIRQIFGPGFSAKEKATLIVKTSREKIITPKKEWNKKWVDFLQRLAVEDPFSAKLGEAWALQQGKSEITKNIPTSRPYPWEIKRYWVKERAEQAIMQIASRSRQGLIWSGKDDLLNLSGGNILAFLSLCQHIWEVWMRDQKIQFENHIPEIDYSVQTLGVLEASRRWFENISSTNDGKETKLFILYIGSLFYKNLTDDETMSYPGENGFSIVIEDLESNHKVSNFLKSAADKGNLIVRPHTSKTKGKNRMKWYLNPILSPYFKIPAIHTKEPMYITIDILNEWLLKSKAFEAPLVKQSSSSSSSSSSPKKNKGDNNKGQIRIFD
ncbi:hypothetical protein [Pseudoflavitalea rhizosphaerae]|uniref:ORC-CDC6 family AAA ATPase n=1 Tax=Pseudoflavitalea rhizosphaerae TaxID=1884793 RepID=UPI000F8D0A23|nr:hypothetical protein [Pseudoflavitalea rhizosphaerae]